MGRSSLAVLQQYLNLAGEGIRRAHMAHSQEDKPLGTAAPRGGCTSWSVAL